MKKIIKTTIAIATMSIITACGGDDLQTNINQVKQDSLKNFIYMQGGTFTMGDFGTQVNGRQLRLGIFNNAPPHEVTLTSYSLSRYQVTWFDYDTFLLATKQPVQKMVNPWNSFKKQYWGDTREPYQKAKQDIEHPELPNPYYYTKPASVQWQDAQNYCQWLGKELKLPINLATEAQWEYAARSGGYKVLYANAKGDINHPPTIRNFDDDQKLFVNPLSLVPVGTYSTPNTAGFYDMDNNGPEYVYDWYSETYYAQYSKISDPKGPTTGKTKVLRGLATTFDRDTVEPSFFVTFRCAVNSDKPVN